MRRENDMSDNLSLRTIAQLAKDTNYHWGEYFRLKSILYTEVCTMKDPGAPWFINAAKVWQLLTAAGMKVEGIKEYRDVHGIDLREAKNTVDNWAKSADCLKLSKLMGIK
jgi:hypothetical protein